MHTNIYGLKATSTFPAHQIKSNDMHGRWQCYSRIISKITLGSIQRSKICSKCILVYVVWFYSICNEYTVVLVLVVLRFIVCLLHSCRGLRVIFIRVMFRFIADRRRSGEPMQRCWHRNRNSTIISIGSHGRCAEFTSSGCPYYCRPFLCSRR